MPDVTRRRLKLIEAGLLMTASALLRVLHFIAVVLSAFSGKRGPSSTSASGGGAE